MQDVVVITGGCSGVGKATAELLRASGKKVVTMDLARDADYQVDVRDMARIDEAAAEIGPVQGLVNSAGIIGPSGSILDICYEDWQRTMDINVTGTLNVCRAFLPGMLQNKQGRIVNVASIAGKEGNPGLGAYVTSKAAVIGLTKSMGKELATSGVLINAIAPAVIATPMNAKTGVEELESAVKKIPMGRLAQANEAAEMISWLLSDRMTFSTGAVFDLSGGRASY